jgi:hypothetical protein
MTPHCEHCPAPADHACPGEDARRLCDLIDLSHPEYRPGYRMSILGRSRPRGKAPDPEAEFARLEAARLAWEALPPDKRKGCCG